METTNSEFEGMMFRVDLIPQEESVLEHFPRLLKYDEFKETIEHKDKVVRYIVYCYDMESPFQKIESLGQKKARAAVMAGFPFEDEKFEDDVVKMMDGKILPINKMIIRYCRLQQSRLYSLIVTGNEAFYGATEQLLSYTPTDDILKDTKTKMEIFDKAKQNAVSLDQMSRELLSGDNAKAIQSTLYTIIDHQDTEIKLTPEDFAR